jgi:hypothetical protein
MWKRRVSSESKGLRRGSDTWRRKNNRFERYRRVKIRRAGEFGEAIVTEKPGRASRDQLIAKAVTAHGYSLLEVASFLRLHYSTISRILPAKKAQF